MKRTFYLHSIALALCGALLLGGCATRAVPARPEPAEDESPPAAGETAPETEAPPAADLSLEAITAHVDFSLGGELAVTRPEKDTTVYGDTYYINGVSDPARELLLNGEPVEDRGVFGSFGVFVELEPGDNVFAFSQGGDSVSVTITRGEGEAWSAADSITRMRPEISAAARAGAEYTLSCVAPSGAAVTAKVGGDTVKLTQTAATAAEGVAAAFSVAFIPGDVDGTVNLGPVVYTLEYDGKTSEFSSTGELFLVGRGADLVVRGAGTCATVFVEEGNDDLYDTTLLRDATDRVTEIGGSMYKLGMGGWVFKDAVQPLAGKPSWQNRVDSAEFSVAEGRETLTLHGSALPLYRADWGGGSYSITLFNTTGAGAVELPGSRLFDGVEAAEAEGATTLTFRPKAGAEPGGYRIEYDGTATRILLRENPEPDAGGRPLTGITVMLDPGHGGSDQGAAGVARDKGPVESEINLATALAVRKYLEGLGATVILSRETDEKLDMDDLTAKLRHANVDLMISLHCNSIDSSLDGTGPSGTETHYFEATALPLAEALQAAVCGQTGRKDRGPKNSYYKVTLNSWAPSVLLEMGFLTNPAEYDSLCSPQGIYDIAAAIGEAVQDAFA